MFIVLYKHQTGNFQAECIDLKIHVLHHEHKSSFPKFDKIYPDVGLYTRAQLERGARAANQ
jgi:hypothetical protein